MFVTACGPRSDRPPSPALADSLTVFVDNANFADATISVFHTRSVSRRLGVVSGNTKATFRFRPQSTEVFFEVDFLAGSTFYSPKMPVAPGDELELRIPASMATSQFSRRKPR